MIWIIIFIVIVFGLFAHAIINAPEINDDYE